MAEMKGIYVTLALNSAQYVAGMGRAAAVTSGFGRTVGMTAVEVETLEKTHRKGMDALVRGSAIGGAALVGLGVAAVLAASTFDAQMSVVQANVDNKTAPSMQRLADAALNAGRTTVFSATDAARAEEELAKAGISAADITGGALTASLHLASAGQIDLGDAAEITASTMTQFGLKAADAGHIADDLAAGADKSLGGVQDLGEALKYAGPNASQFGLSIDDTVGALAEFASYGIKGSMAGTGLREMLVRLAHPTSEATDTMKRLGINTFDAQGKFVGMSNLAGQLATKMKGLTQEQRQSAMAVIFGQRAMTEANILYKDGAAGVAEWSKKVNDQGFAAQQAATKMDNLKGDVQKLSNTFNADLIQSGLGASGALRGVVQWVTQAISGFASLPSWVQNSAVGFSLFSGSALLVVAALGAIVPKLRAGREALIAMGVSAEKTNTLMRALGTGGIVVGTILGIAAASRGLADVIGTKTAPAADKLQVSLAKLVSTGKQTGDIAKYFNSDQLVGDITRLGDPSLWAKVSRGEAILDHFFHASQATSDTNSIAAIQDQLKSLDTALGDMVKGGNLQAAQSAFGNLTKGMSGGQIKQLMGQLPGFKAALDTATAGAKVGAAGNAQYGSAAAQAASQVDQLTNAVNDLTGVFNQRDAARQAAADIDALTASFKANGRSQDINTVKGRANQEAMDKAAQAAGDLRQKMLDAGAGTNVANAAYEKQITKLRGVLQQAGYTKGQIDALLGSVVAVDRAKGTPHISAPGAKPSTDDVAALHHQITILQGKVAHVAADGSVASRIEVSALEYQIGLLRDKTVTIRTNMVIYGAQAAKNAADPRNRAASRWGGVYAHSFAEGGVTTGTVAKIVPAQTLYQYAEPATGGEAFVPKRGNKQRSRSILDTATSWYGGAVAWAARDGGIIDHRPSMPAGRSLAPQGVAVAPGLQPLIGSVTLPPPTQTATAAEMVGEVFYEARRVARTGGRR